MKRTALQIALAACILLTAPGAGADNVGQISTAKRISRQTVVLIDPQGRPGVMPASTDTTVQPGDIITFVIRFTPVPNGATRGLGGYVTDYIPRNTEVVGARLIDAAGNTIPPRPSGFGPDGVGPRGDGDFTPATLPQGSMAQVYGDTGIFYSMSPLTERYPLGDVAGEEFLTLFNGILMDPEPTQADKMGQISGAGAQLFAHNRWDWVQALAFGVDSGAIRDQGVGNTPHLYGSPVAGPDSWYPYEATYTGLVTAIPIVADVVASDTVGPWLRIQAKGGEVGSLAAEPDPTTGAMPDPGIPTRNGVPAVDANGAPLGWALSPSNPLPSYDAAAPDQPYTTAVRFATGELVVGEEYFAEISLRVKATPLDPVVGMDVNCAEVFGGDASSRSDDGGSGGKDNAWRYFLPNPSCVVLNNQFDFSVDKLAVLDGDRLTYTIEGKNLSTNAQTNVQVRQCFADGDFVSATAGGVVENGSAGCPNAEDAVLWNVGDLAAGQSYVLTSEFDAGGTEFMVHRAIYTSDALPFPGFQVAAATMVKEISIIGIDATANPDMFAMAPGAVAYEVTTSNFGTGQATSDRVMVTLPPGFSYTAGSAGVDGAAVADPVVTADPAGDLLVFGNGLADLAPQGSSVVSFSADFPGTQPDGAYTLGVETWYGGAFGRDINDAVSGLAEVLIGVTRSEAPTVSGPLLSGATMVSGTSTEPAGTVITVLVNGIPVATATVDANGMWQTAVPALFAGQNVSASAEANNKLASAESAPPIVVSDGGGTVQCSDGIDNDADGLIDFPDDPGCADASDLDETDPAQCSDGVDNDGDGNIDFPDDPKCAHYLDDDESGMPECSDGIDNDGDGATDTDDPDCADGNGRTETGLPACSNGIDDDNDGQTDFPFDDGCENAVDDDEARAPSGGDDVGPGDPDMGPNTDVGVGDMGRDGRVDPGGVDGPAASGAAEDGCCTTVRSQRTSGVLVLLLLGLLWTRKRKRLQNH